MSRHRRVPEVLQVSAMDCGPAALAAVAEGFGRDVPIGVIRERCRTDVDGTSIESLAELAEEMGLATEQRLLPADMALADATLLPALVVTRLASGEPHFIVAWRRVGHGIEVMDPASGRHVLTLAEFAARLWRHEAAVGTADWLDYALSAEFRDPMLQRLTAIGLPEGASRQRISAALAQGAAAIAGLDAALRHVSGLVARKVVRRGREARLLLAGFCDNPHLLPDAAWSARIDGDAATLAGAVFLSIHGPQRAAPARRVARPAGTARRESVFGIVGTLLGAGGRASAALVVLMAVLATAAGFAELLLFRAVIELGGSLASGMQQVLGLAALLVVLGGGFLLRQALSNEGLRLGRRLEGELRSALLDRLPRIPDSYFESRSAADLAERAHAIQIIRMAPGQLLHLVQAVMEPVGLVICLSLLDPLVSLPSLVALLVALGFSLATARKLGAAEQRQRGLGAALTASFLESLTGLLPLRLHRAEAAQMTRFERRLADWASGARSLARQTRLLGLGADLAILALVASLMAIHFRTGMRAEATDLLFVYWALRLPVATATLAGLAAGLASQRNVIDRLVEPLAAAETPVAAAQPLFGPAALSLRGSLQRNGIAVLDGLDLDIPSGQHVALVGRSGAGKSSLVGLWLGLGQLSNGDIGIDGRTATPETMAALRAATAWIDPANQLFDMTLAENAGIGLPPGAAPHLPPFLDRLLGSLPQHERTLLGEGGLRLSGGEGQRVRIARAMNHPAPRLVLCDEPFRGLDRAERAAMMEVLRRHWAGITLVCVSHDIADTTGFDRVLVLDAGRIVEDDRPDRLIARPTLYRHLLEMEQTSDAALWGAGWRHLRLDGGRLSEHA